MSRELVTGSADGPRRATAENLLADGHALIVHARSTERAGTLDFSRQSMQYAEASIEDYAERTKPMIEAWQGMNYKQGGDPAKLADAFIELAALDEPSVRLATGTDAVATFEQKADDFLAQAAAHRELSASLAFDAVAS